ncbi:VPA1269 family protein [Pseudomonas syringae]|uniref:VPA1269 family protein n=1 Tax=Pseudomonas syringae TaxID=317 RepID=UPI000E31A7AA|nr:VPA1269 family protein [Pseudomonas syringae]
MNEASGHAPSFEDMRVLIQKNKIKTRDQYLSFAADRGAVPQNPRVEYNREWVNWNHFLGVKKKQYYITYLGARTAALKLGFTTEREYKSGYREDDALSPTPNKFYAEKGWEGWHAFLDKPKDVFYKTYDECKQAAKNLGISSWSDYQHKRLADTRLPANPDEKYKNRGWSDWYQFLDYKRYYHYELYSDAMIAVRKLKVRNRSEYEQQYKQDSRLPCSPQTYYAYKGWMGWSYFLENSTINHYTYEEAKTAIKKLKLSGIRDYKATYSRDPRFYGDASKKYKADGSWIDWYDYLGKIRPVKIYTYNEAKKAVKRLGYWSSGDYRRQHKIDPRLPLHPAIQYLDKGWIDWYEFLEKPRNYEEYSEAKKAAQGLSFQNQTSYKENYKVDPRLPINPDKSYRGLGWSNWEEFLGIPSRANLYPYEEAEKLVKKIGFISKAEYLRTCDSWPGLPKCPPAFYRERGWTGWYNFLGHTPKVFYSTLKEAKDAVTRLGIKGQNDYKLRYSEDPLLPASPETFFGRVNWTNWYEFTGRAIPLKPASVYPNMWADVIRWVDDETNINYKIRSIKDFFVGYSIPLSLPDNSKHLLLVSNKFSVGQYQDLIESFPESKRKTFHNVVTAFHKWLMDKYCLVGYSHDRVISPGYRNPFETVMAGFSESLPSYHPNQSTKPVLGYEYILRARDYLLPCNRTILQDKPSLNDLTNLQNLFDSHSDWYDIDPSLIDSSDPNCITRNILRYKKNDGKTIRRQVLQIWSPIRFVALYTLIRFPLRGQQIMWLDSGEADPEEFLIVPGSSKLEWRINNSALVDKGTRKRRNQGAVQKGALGEPKIYITTNKTSITDGGYEVSWMPDDLVYLFKLLKDWQVKYNPITEPTPWANIYTPNIINKKILRARGTQCFLFRHNASGQPLSVKSAFESALPKLLYKIQREGENLCTVSIETGKKKFSSHYTPHSLRVSLITAYITDGEAPIQVISKLVGHASLVMTIYYVIYPQDKMRLTMGEVEKKAANSGAEQLADKIRCAGLSNSRHEFIITENNRPLIDSPTANSSSVIFDWGICPLSSAACTSGGAKIFESKSNLYGPVEPGYLGQKNCIRCRYHITGVPFLGGLVALANEISLEIHTESQRFHKYSREVTEMEKEFYDNCKTGELDTNRTKRKNASAYEQQSAAKLDCLLNDYVAITKHVQDCINLANKTNTGSENIRLLVSSEFKSLELNFDESKSSYHLLSEICQNASIFASTNPARAIPLITQAIDCMAANNNLLPAMYRLTDKQKLVVTNELNSLLLSRLGTWERIDDLFAGEISLLDIDSHCPDLVPISTEIQNLLQNIPSISRFPTVLKL